MDELDRRLAASRDRLRDRVTPPPADHLIARARRRRTQRRAQVAVVGLVAVLAVAVPIASLIGGQHRAVPAGPPSTGQVVTVPTTVTVTTTRGPSPSNPQSGQSAPASSGASGTVASLAPVTAATTIDAGQPILGIRGGYELFARSPQAVARIQFAPGRVTVKPAPGIQSGAGAFFLVGPHAVIARAWDLVPGFLMPDDGLATELPGALSGGGGNTFPGPELGQVWVEETANGAESGVDKLLLVGLDGKKTSVTIPMSGPPLAPDGDGYVLVRGANCLYDVRPDGRTCIASGAELDLVAVGPTGWLLRPCAKNEHCTDVYIDRRTGQHHQTSADINPQQWGVISPDGAHAAVLVPSPDGSDASTLHLIDLRAGTDRTVTLASSPDPSAPSYGSNMAWSPDGQWLFLAAGQIIAVDPTTGHSQAVTGIPGDVDYIQVATRPAPAR